MRINRGVHFLAVVLLSISITSVLPGQQLDPDPLSETLTRRIELQEKGVMTERGVHVDNTFPGARLNAFEYLGKNRYRATIKPENEPINSSPWYAFRIWSNEETTIVLELDYGKYKHRYFPKISHDGIHWSTMDSTAFEDPVSGRMNAFTLRLQPDTLWIAAQEIISSKDVYTWCDTLAASFDLKRGVATRSKQDREIPYLDIYSGDPRGRPAIILLCRQHPPEVPGYFAFQSFVETLLEDNALARAFREKFRVVAFPILNPDGVDLGHWRHNAGGVDLNRDWAYYRQPETDRVSAFIVQTMQALDNSVLLGLDFHSTWNDIYYVNPVQSETLPQFWNYWTAAIDLQVREEYEPNVKVSVENRNVSKNWFYNQFGAEGITFEIGDNTDRDFVTEKGRAAAIAMMQLLMYY